MQFNGPRALAPAADGALWVADHGNHRILLPDGRMAVTSENAVLVATVP